MKTLYYNRIAAFLMICVVIFVVVKRYVFDESKLNTNHRFTVATVYKISYPAEGGPDADFQYCVNQVLYRNYTSFNPNQQKVTVGKTFLLKYYPPNPKIARILLDKPLDSSLGFELQIDTCRETK